MLARVQQTITVSILTAAIAWVVVWWKTKPLLAVGGFVTIVLGYSLLLALEFMFMILASRDDPAPAPSWKELTRAWLGEVMTAPRIFCWSQPFRSEAVPDRLSMSPSGNVLRGVVLVHGFFCNRGFWTFWMLRLQNAGHPFVAVNLEPIFGSIDNYTEIIEKAVRTMTEVTGKPPVIVAHSMGGLAARAWLRAYSGHHRVHHIVTIGSPHRGTWLGRFGHGANASEMHLQSSWILALAVDELANPAVPFTCWYSNCDNIVFPASTATLPDADNRLVLGLAHVDLAFHKPVVEGTLAIIGVM